MTEKDIEKQIIELNVLADNLKISIDDKKRNDFEFWIFYLNNSLSEYEHNYEKEQQELDDLYDNKFIEFRPNVKSDKASEMATNQLLQERLSSVSIKKSKVKKYNRIHRWFIRLGDYITGQKIQENFSIKQNWY